MSYEFRHPLGMMQLQWSVCLLLSLVVGVQCYSTGAPASACSDIYPVGHPATSQDLSTNPFQLSLSDFDQTDGGEIYYVLGQDYTLTLSGSGGEQFRGFLVQARVVADGSPVGTFIDNGDDQTLSSCDPPESAVTHTNSSLKNYLTLNWTAPLQGAGGIRFLYAVVLSRDEFYATQNTDVLHSCGLPLYESDGRCVETCPDGQFGNGSTTTLTGTCDPLPTDNSETVTPYLSFRSKNLPNHSYVDVFSISLTDRLRCRSELQNCCSKTQGNWVFPNGTSLGYSYSNGVYQYNTTQRVELIRVSWITTTPNGIYRCEIAVNSDEPSVTQSLYVGLYTNDGGEIMISRHITLTVNSDLNGASPHFTLTCISTGGPATTVTWTRDSTTVTEGNITVLHNTTTAQYTHTLTVTGRMPGLYNCTVKNNKPSTKSITFTVQVASAPINLASIVAGNDSTSIHLTWTPPTPLRYTTGYRISFTRGGNSSSVDVSGGSTDNYTLTGLTRGEMYNVSIVGISEHFFSESMARDTVTLPDGATASGDERGGEEGKEGAGQKQNYSSGLVAGIVAPFIFLAIVAASALVGWKYLCHRRCIKGLFGSPSATTSTTSNTVNSASPSTPIYDEVDTLRGVTSSHDIQLTSNEAYAPVIKTSANSAYGQYY